MDCSREAVIRQRQARERVLRHELDRVAGLLKARADVRLVLLFGSVAAGTCGPHSDLDLVVVVDTPSEWAQLRQERALLRRIAAEGTVIYEAAA
jgi:predicted nucleotidyltransferase